MISPSEHEKERESILHGDEDLVYKKKEIIMIRGEAWRTLPLDR